MRKTGRMVVRSLASAMILWSAVGVAERLPLERVFGGGAPLAGELAQDVQIAPDGRFVGFTRAAADGAGSVLWIMPMKGGAARPLLDSRKLGTADQTLSEERMKFLERRYQTSASPISYRWTEEGRRLLVTYNDDLYLVDVPGGAVRRLTETEEAEADARLAPGGRHLSFVRGRDLVIRSLADGSETKVAEDSSETVFYGAAEFVAQEEMRRFTGQWWAPDGRHIAYTRVDEGNVKPITRVAIDSAETRVVTERYPFTGTPNAIVQLFVRNAASGRTVEADLGPDRDIYLFDAQWAPGGEHLFVLRQSRDQKRMDLLAIDPATGASRLVLAETSPTYVDIERDFRPLKDGNFIWGSARSGWRHLYLYDRNGTLIRPITSGEWRVTNISVAAPVDLRSVTGVDEKKGLVYFMGSETPLQSHLYAASYRTPGKPRRLTSGDGWWWPSMARDAAPAGFVASYSDPNRPPNTAVYDLKGRRVAWIAENRLDAKHPLHRYLDHRPTPEYGTIRSAGGEDLHYLISKPADFDPNRRYPVLIRVYGGPNVQTIRHEWRAPLEQLIAQEGYILFSLDNRGSVNRSRAFEHALHNNLGGANTEDQLAGVRFLKTLPFVDPDRIGMFGWSYGAYMTFRMMTTPDSGIRAGAAGGIPSEFELYDTHYTERFLGTPQGNPEAYRISNLVPRAGALQGNLLLMHGLSDDNVVVANFTKLVSALQAEGKLFETSVYPGMAHVPRGSHLWLTQFDFFKRRLAPRAGE